MIMFWLMLYMFSAAYDYFDPLGISAYCTTSKLLAACYMMSAIQKKRSLRKILYIDPGILSMFAFCIYFLVVTIIKTPEYGMDVSAESLSSIISISLCVIMMSCLIREMQDPSIRDKAGIVLLLSIISVAVMLLLGIGTSFKGGRIRFFGCNSNTIGFYGAIALIMPFALSRNVLGRWSFLNQGLFYASSVLAGLYLIYQSGSLGALVIAGATVPLILLQFLTRKKSILYWPLLIVFLLFGAQTVIRDFTSEESVSYQRLITMSEHSDVYDENRMLSGRLNIWEDSWKIFQSAPWTGVGDTGYRWEIVHLSGEYHSTHSLYLELLAKTGIIGFVLFMVPIFMLLKRIVMRFDLRSLALLLAVLLMWGKAGGGLSEKILWFLLAYIMAGTLTPAPEVQEAPVPEPAPATE